MVDGSRKCLQWQFSSLQITKEGGYSLVWPVTGYSSTSRGQIQSPWLWDNVNSGMGLLYRPARLHRLAGQYENPMHELTTSPSQRLWIWPQAWNRCTYEVIWWDWSLKFLLCSKQVPFEHHAVETSLGMMEVRENWFFFSINYCWIYNVKKIILISLGCGWNDAGKTVCFTLW